LEWFETQDGCQLSNFSAISWREQVNFQWDDDKIRFVLDKHTELIFKVLAHWNNSPRLDMSLHSATLFWYPANQSLILLLNAAYWMLRPLICWRQYLWLFQNYCTTAAEIQSLLSNIIKKGPSRFLCFCLKLNKDCVFQK
jgi:hypothetical protein